MSGGGGKLQKTRPCFLRAYILGVMRFCNIVVTYHLPAKPMKSGGGGK
jgi:hypothetical protein